MTGDPSEGIISTVHSILMARAKVGLSGKKVIETIPKKTRQGAGKHTKYAASSRNKARKAYRGQGK